MQRDIETGKKESVTGFRCELCKCDSNSKFYWLRRHSLGEAENIYLCDNCAKLHKNKLNKSVPQS